MPRLTRFIKDEIVKNAIENSGLNQEFGEARIEEIRCIDFIRRTLLCKGTDICPKSGKIDTILEKEEKKALRAISKLKIDNVSLIMPETSCFFRRSDNIRLNLGGELIFEVLFSEPFLIEGNTREEKIIPKDRTLPADHPAVIDYVSSRNLRAKVNEKRHNLINKVSATLESFTTTNKLLESWPECKELLPKDGTVSQKSLPAIQVKDLNKEIKLPKK